MLNRGTLISAVFLLLSACTLSSFQGVSVGTSPASYDPGGYGWTIVWADEFNGTNIDPANWAFDTGTGVSGWGNNELQYYTSNTNNVFLTNGNLVIRAVQESTYGTSHTSARLKTHGLHSWTYGKIVARIKMPHGQGILPMLWMLGISYNGFNWPDCGEMVVAEMFGGAGASNRTAYSGIYWNKFGVTTEFRDFLDTGEALHNAYHVFEIEWESNALVSRFDGRPYFSYHTTSLDCAVFQNAFFLILSLTVGGNWAGSPDGSTIFPQTMEVDWIRVYQKSAALPDLTVTYPTASGTVYGRFPVMGTSAGINEIAETCLSVDFSPFSPLSNPTNWSSNLDLPDGAHTLRIYARDVSNAFSTTNLMEMTVTRQLPIVTFTTVPPFDSFNPVAGTVSGVSPELYKISLWIFVPFWAWMPKPYFDAPYAALHGDGTWNSLYNTGGNDGGATKFVAYLVPSYMPIYPGGWGLEGAITNFAVTYGSFNRSDADGPSNLVFLNPTNGQTAVGRNGIHSVTGCFSDDQGGGTLYLSVNGSAYSPSPLALSSTNWSIDSAFTNGNNTVSVYILDDGFHRSETNQISFHFINDNTPPIVTVTSPLYHHHYPWPGSVVLSGTASDTHGVRAVYLEIDNLGYFQANGTNSWSVTWPFLDSGSHTLKVYAEDSLTNTSPVQTVTFFVD